LLHALLSPDIIQVCCNTWQSTLNRLELFEHLRIAHSKYGMVFQGATAEPTRRFLNAILPGKGLRAECTLRYMPSAEALAQPSTLQTLPVSHSLFLAAVSRAEPLWFHPSLAEQLIMGLDSQPTAAAAAGHSACAASSGAQHTQSEENDAHGECDAVTSSANKATVAERPPLQASLLSFVQCVSVELPATSRAPILPSVVIFSSSPQQQQPTAPTDKKRAFKPLRPPPVASVSEEEDNAAALAAEALAEENEAAGEGNGAGSSSFSAAAGGSGNRESLPLGSIQQSRSRMDRSHAARKLDDELYDPSLAPSQASTDAFDGCAQQWPGEARGAAFARSESIASVTLAAAQRMHVDPTMQEECMPPLKQQQHRPQI
jgi:hypothetical protein